MKGDAVTLQGFQAKALDGTVRAEARIDNTPTGSDYDISIQLKDIDFEQLAKVYGSSHDTGGRLSGHARFRSAQPGLQHLKAEGTGRVEDGNIFCLPSFGPLSKPLAAALPRLHDGFNVARQADLRFRIANGQFIADDLQAETGAFHLKGNGTISMATQSLNLETTVNIKGPAGALLVPVAKLLEFEGTGTLADPVWRTKTLGRVKDVTLDNVDNITQSTLGALRKVGEALPKRLTLPHTTKEEATPLRPFRDSSGEEPKK
jgi:uncharacterized protein involved in outer membrane biogenesis